MPEGMSQSLFSLLTVMCPFQSQRPKEKNAKKQTNQYPLLFCT